ncbi:hypothetical protein N8314_01680 [Akkermansiaceae bacterium]|nr:hypothetical protein [Akkermansiaceae bacterium]
MEPETDRSSNDHEHYSVDEMMARLKRHDRDKEQQDKIKDGELVTRPDGSQVIKVKKRRRRSKQPSKKTNPKLKWAVIGTASGLALALVAFTIFIIARYNGASFKEKTEISISKHVTADSTKIEQLRVTPLSAAASKATINWDRESFFHSATFSAIKADIKATSFLSRSWNGEEILAEQGTIQLQLPEKNRAASIDSIISNYRFKSYRCEKLDLLFGDSEDAPSIKGLHASLQRLPSRRYQVTYNSGTIDIPSWPNLEISSGIITLNSSSAEIEARLGAQNNNRGELLIKGIIYKDKDQPVVLDVKSINYPIEDMLGEDFSRIIEGYIHSDMGALSYNPKQNNVNALSFIMPFNSDQLNISELPMLNDLRDLTGKPQYLHPSFTHCRGTIIRNLGGISLSNLNLISSKLLSIEGNISVNAQGMLSGELNVGIPSRLFDDKTPAPKIFSAPKDGNIYTKVTLGGTVHSPHDDFNARLKSSGRAIIQKPSMFADEGEILPITPSEKLEQKEKAFEALTK